MGLRSLAFAVVFATCGLALGQGQQQGQQEVVLPLSPLEPFHDYAQGVSGGVEGWYRNESPTIIF